MYHIIGCIALFLAFVMLVILGSYNSRLGEFFGTFMVFPLLVFLLMIMLIVIYHKLDRKLNKSIPEELIEGKAENNENLGVLSIDTDFYLFSNRKEDIVNYWIKNYQDVVVFQAKCKLNYKVIELIQLYSQNVDGAPNLCILKEADSYNYLVREGEVILGNIKVKKDSLFFYDINNVAIYSCAFEEINKNELNQAIDSILSISSLSSVSIDSGKSKILFMKDREEDLIGKYFSALHNLDLSISKNNIDIRIPLIFSIIVDINNPKNQ